MWQLAMKTPADKDWTPIGTFATVTEAARRIVELEGIPTSGLFWNSTSKRTSLAPTRKLSGFFITPASADYTASKHQTRPTELMQ